MGKRTPLPPLPPDWDLRTYEVPFTGYCERPAPGERDAEVDMYLERLLGDDPYVLDWRVQRADTHTEYHYIDDNYWGWDDSDPTPTHTTNTIMVLVAVQSR